MLLNNFGSGEKHDIYLYLLHIPQDKEVANAESRKPHKNDDWILADNAYNTFVFTKMLKLVKSLFRSLCVLC